MRHLLRFIPLLLIAIGMTLVFEQPAYAYADPGTGLLAIQAAGSALVAVGWYLRRKIHALFHRGDHSRRHHLEDQPQQYPDAQDGEGSSQDPSLGSSLR
jgi:hypothetical protein